MNFICRNCKSHFFFNSGNFKNQKWSNKGNQNVDELNIRNKFGAFQAGKKGKEVITTEQICVHPPYQMKEFGECLQNLHQKNSDYKHNS